MNRDFCWFFVGRIGMGMGFWGIGSVFVDGFFVVGKGGVKCWFGSCCFGSVYIVC